MRAVILEVDERMLAERRRLGLDRHDEMWEGVLHLVPQPTGRHQVIGSRLVHYLFDPAERSGCEVTAEIAVYTADADYRVPDVSIYPTGARSGRGVDGLLLVAVEILSPGDESHAKIPWYLARGTAYVVIVDPRTFAVEVYGPAGPVEAGADGLVGIAELGVRIGRSADGDALVVESEDGVSRIEG